MGKTGEKPIYFAEQIYEEIKFECQKNDQLFDDPKFPSSDPSSLNNTENPTKWSNIIWKRPQDIVSNPKLVVDGSSRHDIQQGDLGDCWLLSAMSSLAMRKDLMDEVVLPNQTFDSEYAGIFRFQIWHFGKWYEIVVDDFLPMYNEKLIFTESDTSENEFWAALLEKACAKLNGSYQALKGDYIMRGFHAFTGGCVEVCKLSEETPAENIYTLLVASLKKSALIACCSKTGSVPEEKDENGIRLGKL